MQIKSSKLKNTNKGITLIALVITIIVLLILAGVAIATITGENGILTKAVAAKEKTSEAEAKEVVQLEAMGSIDDNGKFNIEYFKTNVKKNLGLTDTDIVDNGNTVTVTYKGYDVEIDKTTGELVLPLEPTEVGKIVTGKNKIYTNTTDDGKTLTAVIPVGYGVMERLDNISEGLVITDNFENDGNEFVWIPVETAVAGSETQGTTTKAMAVNMGTEENPKYRGLLYNFDANGSNVISGCTDLTSTSNREPAILSDYDTDTKTYLKGIGLTQESFQTEMQEAYKDMIKSVSINHGFYVSRYEMSLDESNNAQSKKLKPSATNASTSANMWYGLYDKAKNYAKKDSAKSVVSSMIWGSQYDAMMNWMQKGGIKVSSSTPPNTERNETRTTGGPNDGQTESKDILKNVYDLLGNSYEWTLEADFSSLRVRRGGSYDFSSSPAYRSIGDPSGSYDDSFSSRLTLYIK